MGRDVSSIQQDPDRFRPGLDLDLHGLGDPAAGGCIVGVRVCLQNGQPGGAVQGAGVEVVPAQFVREVPGQRALAGSGNAVDGDDGSGFRHRAGVFRLGGRDRGIRGTRSPPIAPPRR